MCTLGAFLLPHISDSTKDTRSQGPGSVLEGDRKRPEQVTPTVLMPSTFAVDAVFMLSNRVYP